MIFATATMIGIAASLTRSAVSIALAAVLIGVVFALAVAVSPGPVAWVPLASAYAGFNAGLILHFVGLLAIERRKAA